MIHDNVENAKKGEGCPSQAGQQDMAARQKQEDATIKASLA